MPGKNVKSHPLSNQDRLSAGNQHVFVEKSTVSSSTPAPYIISQNTGQVEARGGGDKCVEHIQDSALPEQHNYCNLFIEPLREEPLSLQKEISFVLWSPKMLGFQFRTLKQLDDTEGTVRLHDGKESLIYVDIRVLLMSLKQGAKVINSVTMIWCSSRPSLKIPTIPYDGQHGENGWHSAACVYWPSFPMLPWPASIQPSWTSRSSSPHHMLKSQSYPHT